MRLRMIQFAACFQAGGSWVESANIDHDKLPVFALGQCAAIAQRKQMR